jgi:hypothetical protein
VRGLWLVALVAGCGFEHGTTPVVADGGDTDPDVDTRTIDVAPLGPWGTPVLVVTANVDDDPTSTTDLLELYFNRASDIWIIRRATIDADWGSPSEVSQLSSGATDTTPEVTGDGLTMFLSSSRSGAVGGTLDIWVSTRLSRSALWTTPSVVPELNTTSDDTSSAVTDDALALAWNVGPVNVEDLYASRRETANSGWDPPTELTSLNTASREASPMFSQDRLTLYFSSSRTGNEDLYVATRATITDPFANPQPIAELNSPFADSDPWVSADGRHMFFASDRSGVFGIYEVSR